MAGDYVILSEFPAATGVAAGDLVYSADATTGDEKRITAQQLQTYVQAPIANSTLADAGTLGTETVPVARGSLLQTSLTKLASFVLEAISLGSSPGVGTLTGTETFPVGSGGELQQATANDVKTFVLSTITQGTSPAAAALTGTEAVPLSQNSALAQTTLSNIGTYALSPIAKSKLTLATGLTGSETIPISQSASLFQLTLTGIANWILNTYNGFTQAGTGAVARTIQSKLQECVSVMDFGAKGDGITDDTAAIQAAADAAHVSGTTLAFNTGLTYRISADVHIRRPVIFGPSTTIMATQSADAAATVNFWIERALDVVDTKFSYVNLVIAPSDATPGSAERVQIRGVKITNANLVIGLAAATVRGFEISHCEFRNGLSRWTPAIVLNNASDVYIHHNAVQEYTSFVQITPTRSFACHNITIEENTAGNSPVMISARGTSAFRISNLTVRRNIFTATLRDAISGSYASILATYCTNLVIDDNTIASQNDNLKLQACLVVKVRGNRLTRTNGQAGIRISGCRKLKILSNTFHAQPNTALGYDILVLGPAQNSILTNNPYASSEVIISENDFSAYDRSIKVDIATFVHVTNNTFTAAGGIALSAFGFVWFTLSAQNCSCMNNRYYATNTTQTPIRIDAGATVVTDTTAATSVAITTATPVVTQILSGLDSTLNNSNAFIYKFTVSDARQITAIADTVAASVPARMASITGAQLAFNASAWNTTTLKLPDIITNGQVFDSYGLEDFWWAKSGGVIDTEGVLTVRDFFCLGNGNSTSTSTGNSNIISDIGSRQIAECAYHSAYFRSPLVMDGVIYDPTVTGILSSSAFTTSYDPRMAIGQDATGAFYVICVNGRNADGVSPGCSLAQLAAKFLALGCINAFNMDGGGSATLWVNGTVVNAPSDGTPRAIYNMWYL